MNNVIPFLPERSEAYGEPQEPIFKPLCNIFGFYVLWRCGALFVHIIETSSGQTNPGCQWWNAYQGSGREANQRSLSLFIPDTGTAYWRRPVN